MKELPMIFSGTIEAIKNTKPGVWPAEPIDPSKPFKWQTRRIINRMKGFGFVAEFGESTTPGYKYQFRDKHLRWNDVREIEPPWLPGDILWVWETWSHYGWAMGYIYKADHEFDDEAQWRPSIFMPRSASRFALEIKNVRIERLWDITERDAKAEGVNGRCSNRYCENPEECAVTDYTDPFISIWNSINAKRGNSWHENPWVYVIEFMRIK
jgi:hypothetical protein